MLPRLPPPSLPPYLTSHLPASLLYLPCLPPLSSQPPSSIFPASLPASLPHLPPPCLSPLSSLPPSSIFPASLPYLPCLPPLSSLPPSSTLPHPLPHPLIQVCFHNERMRAQHELLRYICGRLCSMYAHVHVYVVCMHMCMCVVCMHMCV